jgi:hypothetical protein
MHQETATVARESLRHLAMPHAIDFGQRLLGRGKNGVIHFREFVAVARELLAERPDQTAHYLAALVALDMGTPEVQVEPRPFPGFQPSRN